jgi:WSC domain
VLIFHSLGIVSSTSSVGSTSTSSATPTQTGPIHVPSVGAYTWIGCYTEATGSRALTGAVEINYQLMTVEMCQAFCSSPTQFTYFGVEYAGECYCGNTIQAGSVIAPTTDCSMLCDGSNLEYCGAGNRLDVSFYFN